MAGFLVFMQACVCVCCVCAFSFPSLAAAVQVGRNLATLVLEEIHLACRAGNTRDQSMKRRILLQGSTQEAAVRAWLRLAWSSSRYAGRLVPGSCQAAAAAAGLSPATGGNSFSVNELASTDIFRRLSVLHVSIFQGHGQVTGSQSSGKGVWIRLGY